MHKLWPIAFSVGLFVATAPVRVCADPGPSLNPGLRDVLVNLKSGSIDDQLIELARAGGMNFIADAGALTAAESKVAGEAQGKFAVLLSYFCTENQLGLSHIDNGLGQNDLSTLLFWPSVDVVGVARRIAAGEAIEKLVARQTDDDFLKALSAYLVQAHRWDINRANFEIEFQVAELPPALRHEMNARIQAILHSHVNQNGVWIRPETWSTATVLSRPSGVGSRVSQVFVSPNGNQVGYGYIVPTE